MPSTFIELFKLDPTILSLSLSLRIQREKKLFDFNLILAI